MLTADNTLPKVSTKFYKAVVQSVLLYGSKTWNLTTTASAWLEGFHIHAAYRMAEKHKPKKGPHHEWVYPRSFDALKENRMATILHYINVRRALIFRYVVNWPIYKACREGDWRRGLPLRQWWWEQKMSRGRSQRIMATRLGRGKAFRWTHLNSGDGFTGNARRTLELFAGSGSAAPLWRLCHRPCLLLTKGRQVWWVEIVGYKSVIP